MRSLYINLSNSKNTNSSILGLFSANFNNKYGKTNKCPSNSENVKNHFSKN